MPHSVVGGGRSSLEAVRDDQICLPEGWLVPVLGGGLRGKAKLLSQLVEAIVLLPAKGQGSGWGRDVCEEGLDVGEGSQD